MAMLFGFSSLSKIPTPPSTISYYDVHLAAYAGLGLLTARALARGSIAHAGARVVAGAVVISSIYGVTDEYHQLFVPGRNFDVLDIAADAIGSIIGASAPWAWGIIRRRFETRDAL